VTARLAAVLAASPGHAGDGLGALDSAVDGALAALADRPATDVLADEDVQLALDVLYELHYRGFDGVADGWEWEPGLLAVRARLEAAFECGVLAATPPAPAPAPRTAAGIAEALFATVAADDGPSLSTYVARRATLGQVREVVVHRSAYHLKEADPHTWGIPRLAGATKAALVEIQADEYGGGRPGRMHSELFRGLMRALDLDDGYGAYLDRVPAPMLAVVNLMSFVGLHRARRGMLVGHLAAVEMGSSVPSRRYAAGLRRLRLGRAATEFYEEHVLADAAHEQVAAHDLCGTLVATEPDLADDVLLGARAGLALDALFAGHVLARWDRGESSLLGHGPVVRGSGAAAVGGGPRAGLVGAVAERG